MAESFYNTALGATLKAQANLKTVSSFRVRYGAIEGANRSRISNLKVDKNYFRLDFFSDTSRVGCFQIFSMHPTHLGMSNSLLSADLVGHIENASVLDGSPCLFFNGTVGNAEAHNVGEPEAYGKEIWKKGNLLNEEIFPSQFSLISMPISLPKPRLNLNACGIPPVLSKTTHFGILKTLPRQTKISTFNFGHFSLAFVPGEPTYDLWEFLNQNHSSRKLIFVSLANDYLGYLSTHTVYNTKALESCSNLYGPNIQRTLQDNFKSIALD